MSRSRTCRHALAITIAALTLSACATAPTGPVATVDGVEIPRELLEGWVRVATDGNSAIDAVGLQADLLSRVIQQLIIDGLLAERELSIDPALREEIRAAITEQVGGQLALDATLIDIGFAPDYFENVFLGVEASIDTLVLALAQGRTLETRTARHILVDSAEEADEVFALLQAGADFAALAIERSVDPGSGPRGGDLGPQQRGVFVPPFDAAVWAATVNTVLAPVESEFGFHVIEVTATATSQAADLGSQERRSLVLAELDGLISTAFATSAVTVDPTIGVWDQVSGSIVPAA